MATRAFISCQPTRARHHRAPKTSPYPQSEIRNPKSAIHLPTSNRGSILIAIVIALVIVQIAVVGIVALGRFDQHLTKLRLESEQAQYAAESGICMALREVYNSADEDTDGGIGTISAKTVNGCSVSVTSSSSGGTTTLTATATATTAKRVVVVKYSG